MTEEELAISLFPQPQQNFAAPVSQEQVMPAPQFAVNPEMATPMGYGDQYQDVRDEAMRVLGTGATAPALEDFYRQHYQNYGINEGRVAPTNFAVPMSQEQAMPAAQFAVNPYLGEYGGDEYGYYGDNSVFGQASPLYPSFAIPENYGNPKNKIYQLSAAPDEKVRLVGLDGSVYYEGQGSEGASRVSDMVQQLGKQFNTGATWILQKQTPGSDSWQQVSQDTVGKQKTTALNSFLNAALPVAGSVLGGPWGAAAASALNSALQTKPLDSAIKDAALAFATSYVGGKVFPGVNPNGMIGSNLASSAASNAATSAAMGEAASEAAKAAVAQGLTGAAKDAFVQQAVDGVLQGITVTAANTAGNAGLNLAGRTLLDAAPSMLGGGGDGFLRGGGDDPLDLAGIEVTASPQPQTNVVPPFAFDSSMISPGIDPNTSPYLPDQPLVPQPEITPPYQFDPATIAPLLSIPGILDLPNKPIQTDSWTDTPTKPSLTDIIDLLGPLAAGAGALGGRGGSGQAGPYARAPIFSANLPAPKGIYANLAPRDTSGIDYKNYGYGPERSFYANVPDRAAGEAFTVPVSNTPTGPVNSAPPAENTPAISAPTTPAAPVNPNRTPIADLFSVFQDETAPFTAEQKADLNRFLIENIDELDPNSGTYKALKAAGYKRGGNVFAVNGPGTGRSDEIDAKLSDGEYVIDAETVALLGDGSSKAGAQKLDKFRVNVRKHKGANLSKGKFSVDAKAPEAYMSGGRN